MKALTCLESNEATPADVYIFWHAVIGATREVLVNTHSQFPIEVQDEIFGIFQKRHNQVFGEGNLSSSAMLYLAAAYLHPSKYGYTRINFIKPTALPDYLHSDLFQDDAGSTQEPDMEGIRHAILYKTVERYLATIAADEIRYGTNKELVKYKGKGSQFKMKFREELKRYARQQYPFNEPINEEAGIIGWWTTKLGQKEAEILSVCCPVVDKMRTLTAPADFSRENLLRSCQLNARRTDRFEIHLDDARPSIETQGTSDGCNNDGKPIL